MASEQDVFHGFHFLMKNVLAAVFRFWFIVTTCRHHNDSDVASKPATTNEESNGEDPQTVTIWQEI